MTKSQTPTYRCWCAMYTRCNNPRQKTYSYYGGKGVTICERWRSFANFLADMGEKPPNTTLDRISSAGNYEPGNCRWATRREQALNRSMTIWVTHNGETLCLKDWARRLHIGASAMRARLKRGWTPEMAITTPAKKSRCSFRAVADAVNQS